MMRKDNTFRGFVHHAEDRIRKYMLYAWGICRVGLAGFWAALGMPHKFSEG